MSALIRYCFWLLSKVPPRLAYRVSRVLARCMWMANSDAARTTRINLETCFPDTEEAERRALALESLTHMVLLAFEFSYLSNWPAEDLLGQIRSVEGRELLDRAWDDDRGILLLLPHFGCWELMSVFLGAHYSMAALYDPPRIKALEPVISAARERHGGSMYPITAAGLRGLMKTIRAGGLAIILPDQVPGRQAGSVVSTFFGQPVQTMSLTHRVLTKTNAQALVATVQRSISSQGLSYVISFQEVSDDELRLSEQSHADVVNRSIELAVAHAPEQYQWEYKRFKRPPGELGKSNIYRNQ